MEKNKGFIKNIRTLNSFIETQNKSINLDEINITTVHSYAYVEPKEAMQIYDEIDLDHDGTVTLSEIVKYFTLKMAVLDAAVLSPNNEYLKIAANNMIVYFNFGNKSFDDIILQKNHFFYIINYFIWIFRIYKIFAEMQIVTKTLTKKELKYCYILSYFIEGSNVDEKFFNITTDLKQSSITFLEFVDYGYFFFRKLMEYRLEFAWVYYITHKDIIWYYETNYTKPFITYNYEYTLHNNKNRHPTIVQDYFDLKISLEDLMISHSDLNNKIGISLNTIQDLSIGINNLNSDIEKLKIKNKSLSDNLDFNKKLVDKTYQFIIKYLNKEENNINIFTDLDEIFNEHKKLKELVDKYLFQHNESQYLIGNYQNNNNQLENKISDLVLYQKENEQNLVNRIEELKNKKENEIKNLNKIINEKLNELANYKDEYYNVHILLDSYKKENFYYKDYINKTDSKYSNIDEQYAIKLKNLEEKYIIEKENMINTIKDLNYRIESNKNVLSDEVKKKKALKKYSSDLIEKINTKKSKIEKLSFLIEELNNSMESKEKTINKIHEQILEYYKYKMNDKDINLLSYYNIEEYLKKIIEELILKDTKILFLENNFQNNMALIKRKEKETEFYKLKYEDDKIKLINRYKLI